MYRHAFEQNAWLIIWHTTWTELRAFYWSATLDSQHILATISIKLSSMLDICLQGFSETARAIRCRWCCLPLWFGLGMACLFLHPLTMSRTKSFKKPRSTSKVFPKNSASSLTAARLRVDHTMSSRSYVMLILNYKCFVILKGPFTFKPHINLTTTISPCTPC